jgi:hypothetical protein
MSVDADDHACDGRTTPYKPANGFRAGRASAMFYTALNDAFALASAAKTIDGKPQRVVITVESGGRVYRTKPIAPVNVALGAPVRPPG